MTEPDIRKLVVVKEVVMDPVTEYGCRRTSRHGRPLVAPWPCRLERGGQAEDVRLPV